MPKPVYGTLSNTYRSDRTFTPLAPTRGTASKFLYSTTSAVPQPTAHKWGRDDLMRHLPDTSVDTSASLGAKIKGHRHFNSGWETLPEDVSQYQVYNLTALKRSNTRPHDHLVLEPQKINIQESQIRLPFPRQHQYYSHLSHTDIFPQHKPPAKAVAVREEEQGEAAESDGEYDVEPVLTFDREFKPDLRSSTKGNPWRTEALNSSWRPGPKPRPAEQKVSAETYNQHKDYAKSLKTSHYSRTHGYAINALPKCESSPNLQQYTPSWKHQILRKFNARHSEPLPDIRRPKEKRHIFSGVNTMSIEHG